MDPLIEWALEFLRRIFDWITYAITPEASVGAGQLNLIGFLSLLALVVILLVVYPFGHWIVQDVIASGLNRIVRWVYHRVRGQPYRGRLARLEKIPLRYRLFFAFVLPVQVIVSVHLIK